MSSPDRDVGMKKPPLKIDRILPALQLCARSFGLIWQASPSLTALSLGIVLLGGLVAPVRVWVSKLMIDRITQLLSPEVADWTTLLLPLALYVVVWLIGQVSQSVGSSIHELVAVRYRDYGLYRILQRAAQFDLAFFESPAFYDRMALAKDRVWLLENFVYMITYIATQAISLVSMLALLGSIGWALPLALALTSLPKLGMMSRLVKRITDLRAEHVPDLRIAKYVAQLLSERETVKEIRLFQLQNHLIERRNHIYRAYLSNLTQLNVSNELAISVLTLISILGTVCVWIYAGVQALARQISLGDVALVFQATERSRMALDQIAVTAGRVTECMVYLGALFEFLDLSPDAVEGTLHRPERREKKRAPKVEGTIEFRNVSFRYPGTEREVLQNVSFILRPGQKAALVGENGAGKTTLVKLLARLYDPTEGAILLDGCDLREIEPGDHYRQVAVLFQDFVRYELTARENIGFGDVAAVEDMVRIERAAEKGGAVELIEGLPQEYETLLGRRFEGSTDLSGGEWQKLALSRAFMREASLLILDEPTAALDARAENEVYRRFAALTEGKSTLLVTHRLASVRMADRILVLKGGRLIEEGTHESLMEEEGEYAAMFTLQAERYVAK